MLEIISNKKLIKIEKIFDNKSISNYKDCKDYDFIQITPNTGLKY